MRGAWSLLSALAATASIASVQAFNTHNIYQSFGPDRALSIFERPPECPPCFNCNLADFQCHQFANCTAATGRCSCPAGWGGEDCTTPLCGSLSSKERPPRKGKSCDCEDGWEGINCNICNKNSVCNALVPGGEGGMCYTGGLVVRENYQQCAVTNERILRELKGQKPEVTFSCNKEDATCNFQFWVDQRESFYCGLTNCTSAVESLSDAKNQTQYSCDKIKCKCVPGRMLCGENGSIDLGDFLEEEIKGPASFTSTMTEGGDSGDRSEFSEPAMNDLISNVFGDEKIFLQCGAGECIHESEIPGKGKAVKKINTPLIAGIIAACALFIVATALGVYYLSQRKSSWGPIHLSDDEDDEAIRNMMDHKPTSLAFKDVTYTLKGKQIIYDIQGAVQPGELMAIMGASGAGKTTFLDILARKNKRGNVRGEFYINGEKLNNEDFKKMTGFVDQDDTLLPTLTVHETIVDSAMLRLPKDMSMSVKLQRVEDVEKQLGIHHIRHQIIGSEEGSGRGISGGEKRRVGIACELVTSPSILFLDEPTSGLDAFNAFNVVECLANLVKNYNRTVIMTIHQPRSNIVALFDQLVLLAKGRTVYSGPFSTCQSYFDSIGFSCPPGFNIADYLVDLTMHAGTPHTPMEADETMFNPREASTRANSTAAIKSIRSVVENGDQDSVGSPADRESLLRPKSKRKISVREQQDRKLFARKATSRADDEASIPESLGSKHGYRFSTLRGIMSPRSTDDPDATPPLAEGSTGTNLDLLIAKYKQSEVASTILNEMENETSSAYAANGSQNPNIATNGGSSMKSFSKVGIPGQFKILSVRIWRNLYRNPMLMLTHYAIAIVLAVFLGYLFFNLSDDIKGFQNRLGLFFFLLALFGFSTLTTLAVFAEERLLFMRERAKGYYSPISYFAAKVIFDIVPLRLIPPIIMGAIVYPMTGLIASWPQFLYFILFLVLFNLAAAAICLFIGIIFKNAGVANLIGSLVMLFSLLLSGFLLNHESIPKFALPLQWLSIFHYAFEGLIVNEVTPLRLVDHKYGLDIEVPGAVILSSFGFDNQHKQIDAVGLGVFCASFVVLAYIAMHFLLVERR